MRKCEFCDLEFETVSSLANHIRWKHKRSVERKECKTCGKAFELHNITVHERRCSVSLNSCETCFKPTRNRRFCSKSCSATKNNEDGKIGYSIYRKKRGIEQQRTYRDICLELWSPRCAICGWCVSIDIHHIDGDHSNDDIKNLIPLCQNHHIMTRMNQFAESMRSELSSLVDKRLQE